LTVHQPPRSTPWAINTSQQYSEQLGTNRHAGGSNGRRSSWYARTTHTAARTSREVIRRSRGTWAFFSPPLTARGPTRLAACRHPPDARISSGGTAARRTPHRRRTARSPGAADMPLATAGGLDSAQPRHRAADRPRIPLSPDL